MKVEVVSRSGKTLASLDLVDDASVDTLKKAFKKARGTDECRQRLTTEDKKVLVDGKKLSDFGVKSGDKVLFKDLGMQIGYQTVFICEYLFPMIVFPWFYTRPSFIYGQGAADMPYSEVQTWAMYMWVGHYLKRELETVFVHKFSHGTMPIFNLFKNSSYYWGFAVLCAYFVNHPDYKPIDNMTQVYIGFGLMAFAELNNLHCHIIQSNLRPAGTKERNIPYGNLFNFVSCANYFWEITAWLGYNIATMTVIGYVFMLFGAGQMWIWAVGKHKRYRKEFNGKDGNKLYPRSRKILVPFIA